MLHEPNLVPSPGGGPNEWTYADGDVHAILNTDLRGTCEILELSSPRPGLGHAKAAVVWLRERFGKVAVNDPGNEADTPASFGFWVSMVDAGLVDSMVDGDGNLLLEDGRWIAETLDPEMYPDLVQRLNGGRSPSSTRRP